MVYLCLIDSFFFPQRSCRWYVQKLVCRVCERYRQVGVPVRLLPLKNLMLKP